MIARSKDELATSEESGLLGNYRNGVEPPYETQLNFRYSLSVVQETNLFIKYFHKYLVE